MKTKSWTENQLRVAALNSKSVRQIIFKLHLIPAGGNYTQIQKYLKFYKINTKHFTGKAWNKGMKGIGAPRIPLDEILKKDTEFQSYKLKKRLFSAKLKKPKCELCGWSKKSIDGRIPLELDHINGNSRDNRIENLRILCPNCHSQTEHFAGKNIKKHK